MKEKIFKLLAFFVFLLVFGTAVAYKLVSPVFCVDDGEIIGMEVKNNQLHIENTEESYEVECAINPLFIGSYKFDATNNKTTINLSKNIDLWVRIKQKSSGNTYYFLLKDHIHSFEKDEVYSKPSKCKTEGIEIHKCTECGTIKNEVLPALDHKLHIAGYKDSSCTNQGYTLLRCERCGDREYNYLPVLPHNYEFTKTLEPATCTKKGKVVYNCSVCSLEKIEEINEKPHSFIYNGEVSAEGGMGINLKCSQCSMTSNKLFSLQGLGSYQGTIYIPSQNICVPVYLGSPGTSQKVCDAADSASLQLYSHGIKDVIADHYYQGGFTKIRNMPIGDVLYYKGNTYKCVENTNGVNNKRAILSDSGADIRYGSADLYLYTCNNNSGYSVRVVGFKQI